MRKPRPDEPPAPLAQAGPVRRIFHLLIAAAGWALFAYWWWLVLGRTGRDQMVWTALFVGISFAVIVTVTVLWVVHNVAIFRRRGPRRSVRVMEPELRHDVLGRPLRLRQEPADIGRAAVVHVLVEGESKVYRTDPPGGEVRARLAGLAEPGPNAGDSA